ncbi:MAG: hypothetical protein JNM74_06615, partial [Myxococcales bacterium]|nr:hypothetical protein [Myxococcales bacterium]
LGYGRAPGDVATGADTTCTGITCGVDTYVSSHACVPCAPGTTNDAGDDATGDDTSCAPVLCEMNERVASHACVACPPGTTNAAGDDASAVDTACDATICSQYERVLHHACEPCLPGYPDSPYFMGTVNDASGPDSGCRYIYPSNSCDLDNGGCEETQDCRVDGNNVRHCVASPEYNVGGNSVCPRWRSLYYQTNGVLLGFEPVSPNVCRDLNECELDPALCPGFGLPGCINLYGGITCYDPEFEDPSTVVHECQPRSDWGAYRASNGGCSKFVTCTDGIGDPPTCGLCPHEAAPGSYPRLDGVTRPFENTSGAGPSYDIVGRCVNVDECQVGNGPCDPLAICMDKTPDTREEATTPGPYGAYGGFECVCGLGTVEFQNSLGYNPSLPNGYNAVVNGVVTRCTPIQ